MAYDFDARIERRGTNSLKWETKNPAMNGEGMLPLWVADMDFACPPEVTVEASWMASISGIVPGMHVAIDAFTSPGDKVLIQTPVYHPFFHAVENRGREVVASPLLEQDGRYDMDWDDLGNKLSDECVKLMLLCSPHNPVGRVWTKEELLRLGELCVEQGVIVVADEIHCDLVYDKGSHTPYYSLPEELAKQRMAG